MIVTSISLAVLSMLGSFFLATAWHRAMGVRRPVDRRLRAMLPKPSLPAGPATVWWLGACILVLGGAAEGVLTHVVPGRDATLVYLGSLAVVLAGALVTVVAGPRPVRQPVREQFVYLGDDARGRALEVMSVEGARGAALIIHAMQLRVKYRKQYEEAKGWRR